jgi:dTDP-4-dehydrorhamnose reductase
LEIAAEAEGLLHLSCTGQCSRYELMALVFDRLGLSCKIVPALARDFPALAPRPKNMAIATERMDWAGRLAMPEWKTALIDFLAAGGFTEDGAG